jgi:site-specific recombinase XerD
MQKSNARNLRKKAIPHLDFKPADLKRHSDDNWIIVFYWKPYGSSEKMQRFRRRVKHMNSKRERLKYVKTKINHINKLLESGWSPVDEKSAFKGAFVDLLDEYINHYEKRLKNNNLRFDTYRTYNSFVRSLKLYVEKKRNPSMDVKEFSRKFALEYLEHKEYKNKASQRTINNHLSFLYNLNRYMIDREYLEVNVVADIPTRKINKEKIRRRIPEDTKKEIFNYLKKHNNGFYVLSLMTYLCFIRRTEITKLKVKDIILARSLIVVPASVAKSKKEGYVTIPDQFAVIIARHIKNAKPNDYIFSTMDFQTGKTQMKPRKISDCWFNIRKKLNLPKEYQFYSLKDTGITENFEKGIPAIKIRNQARHENISTTELYAPKKEIADQTIREVYYEL